MVDDGSADSRRARLVGLHFFFCAIVSLPTADFVGGEKDFSFLLPAAFAFADFAGEDLLSFPGFAGSSFFFLPVSDFSFITGIGNIPNEIC